ncbi:hypothetical protein F4808DRAFT_453783 [Astrocystis sublimbata]|nr:hypothetical protein F4808DRAFT_453783 [Astrocystis sublimbata]
MSLTDDIQESRRLVRMYSNDVEGRMPRGGRSDVLVQALSQERLNSIDDSEPWKKFFDPPELSDTQRDSITDVIVIESNKLLHKCNSFLSSCSINDRLDIIRSAPTMEGVIKLAMDIGIDSQSKRESSRRGKAMRYLHKFCGTVDAHKTILEIIPKGNEYVSVFAGSLKVVIQASVNHERVSDGLPEALCTISEHVVECKTKLELYPNQDMVQLIADFYAHIFIFLSDVMGWFTEKKRQRLLDSFNEKFFQKFEDQLGKIQQRSETIRKFAAQCAQAEQRYIRVAVENMAQDVRIGLIGQQRHEAEVEFIAERLERELNESRLERQQLKEDRKLFKLLAHSVLDLLEDKAGLWIGDLRTKGMRMTSLGTESQLSGYPSQLLKGTGENWSSMNVLLDSKHLEDFFHRDRVRLEDDGFGPISASTDAIERISEWMKGPPSFLLWLEGPPIEADDSDNPITVLANRVVQLAEQAQIPVISYCCELRRGETLRVGNDSREAQASVALLCSLVRQMMELLLPTFQADANLSKDRFALLDGCILSWSELVHVFRDLLPLMPETLLCVVDGMHWLDDRSTDKCLAELIQALRGTKMRVLFTTTGRSACLMVHLDRTETHIVEMRGFEETDWTLEGH